MRALVISGLAVAALAACGGGDAPPVCTGGWHVCRGQLRDADGRAVLLRGINLSGDNKGAPYIASADEPDVARLRDDWGLNAIRWVMPWAAIEPTEGAYDDAYLAAVRQRLDWAEAHGLLVILDMHQDVYGEGFGFDGAPRWTCDEARYAAFRPREPWSLNYLDANVMACVDELYTVEAKVAAFAAAWRHVAEQLGDHPAVLGFDILNEPHWGSAAVTEFEADVLQPFEQRVIDEVRAAAPGWVAFAEPSSSRNFGFPTTLVPFDAADVVYAPHAYDPQAEQGHGFDPAQRESFIGNIALLRGEADRLGAALWIGEYGGPGGDPAIGAYLDATFDGAAAVAGSTMLWDYARGGGYSPVDADGAEVPAVVDAIVRPYPERVAGDPIDYAFDEATGALTVRWHPDPSIAAPTVIAVPPRLGAVDVACGGCAVTVTARGVELAGGDGADPAVATITPR